METLYNHLPRLVSCALFASLQFYLCTKFEQMIIVTGAAGFISSCLVEKLNREGREDLILVDDFSRADKRQNWENK